MFFFLAGVSAVSTFSSVDQTINYRTSKKTSRKNAAYFCKHGFRKHGLT